MEKTVSITDVYFENFRAIGATPGADREVTQSMVAHATPIHAESNGLEANGPDPANPATPHRPPLC